MKLSCLLPENLIFTKLSFHEKSKDEIVSHLSSLLYNSSEINHELTESEVCDEFLKRENEFSSAAGDGFAFPHARFAKIKGFYMILGICDEGADFGSLDKKPVNFFIASVNSNSNVNLLLQARAAMVHFLLSPETRGKIIFAGTPVEVWNLIEKASIEIGRVICASDLMFSNGKSLNPEMFIRDASIELHRQEKDSLPACSEDGTFLGDISCHEIFSLGLPNFFLNLKTISFVKQMNPFEKYFHLDQSLKVKDILGKRDSPVIAPDATLMEIIFEMTTHDRHILYVVENGKLKGVIDRFSIIDKILVNT